MCSKVINQVSGRIRTYVRIRAYMAADVRFAFEGKFISCATYVRSKNEEFIATRQLSMCSSRARCARLASCRSSDLNHPRYLCQSSK